MRSLWGKAEEAPKKGGKQEKKPAHEKKVEEAPVKVEEKPVEKTAEEDEMDLFGDDDEEDSVSII